MSGRLSFLWPGLVVFIGLVGGLAGCDCAGQVERPFDRDAAPDCSDPRSTGCPCDTGEPFACYEGPPETRDVGTCRAGLRFCSNGTWGECQGAILPGGEVCNGEDDDCDREIDDGALSSCGTCGTCEETCFGPDCVPWGELGPGLVETDDQWITLARTGSLDVVWPSSARTGEIFRVNAGTHAIEAAFWTGPLHGARERGDGDSPSRAAVNDVGDVFIVNRTFMADERGSVTRIAADPAGCPDVDRDGTVETSTGWSDKRAFDSRELWDDECILWHSTVGIENGVPRPVVLHQKTGLDGVSEDVAWVGLYGEYRFVSLDAETGEDRDQGVASPGLPPYSAAIDRDGRVWFVGVSQEVRRFDAAHPEAGYEEVLLPKLDGAARVIVDEQNTPWISASDTYRWDYDTEAFVAIGLPVGLFGSGNLVSDGQGSIWQGTTGPRMFRIDRVTGEFHDVAVPGMDTWGTAADFLGQVWAFGLPLPVVDDNNLGMAAVVDVETERVTYVMEDCGGLTCLVTPYVRGDITGMQRQHALTQAGEWAGVFDGCTTGETDWKTLRVEAFVPPETEVQLAVRTSLTLPALVDAEWIDLDPVAEVTQRFDLDAALGAADVPDRALIEVRVALRSHDRTVAPVVQRVAVEKSCPLIVD